jgi:hypothetical protein
VTLPPAVDRTRERWDDLALSPIGRLVRAAVAVVAAVLLLPVALSLVLPGSRPVGVLLYGAVIGCLYGLIAVGVVLVYRANRVVNFAQAGLGAAPAVLALLLLTDKGVPYLVALPVAIVGALALGALVEVAFIRRFASAPRLVLAVVTIGVAQLLAYVEFQVPKWVSGDVLPPNEFPTPFSGTVGAPSPVDAPVPVVPEGGTFVAGRGGSADDERSGALAVSALRLLLPDDVQASAVTLEVADVRGEPVVAVCPATSFWEPVQGGRFEDAPTADCTQAATGTVQDGRLVVPLDGVASPGTLDVVLLPAVGAAFSLTLQPATAESVTTVPLSAASPESELAPAPEPAAAPPTEVAGPTATVLPPFDPTTAFAAPPPLSTGPPLLAGELPALTPPSAAPAPQAVAAPVPLAVRPSTAVPSTTAVRRSPLQRCCWASRCSSSACPGRRRGHRGRWVVRRG